MGVKTLLVEVEVEVHLRVRVCTCVTSWFPELKNVRRDGEQEKKPNGGQHQLERNT